MDFTGTGNSLNPVNPSVLRLIMDSLRYFVIECHVDGFRFDLASALARELYDVDRLSAFFDVIHQDPVLSQVKLIAEPWDVGPGGYQVGNFPILWSEWNGMYRDTMRDFWRGHTAVAEFARRFTGSSDLYQDDGRHPSASINFVTCHDGFTLRDLVSYDRQAQRGEPRGQPRRDRRQPLVELRRRGRDRRPGRQRAARPADAQLPRDAAALAGHADAARRATSCGTRSTGNNNAYCQDNELSWLDWELDERDRGILEFTKRLLRLRAEHPVFRRVGVPHRRGAAGVRRARRLVVPARTAAG